MPPRFKKPARSPNRKSASAKDTLRAAQKVFSADRKARDLTKRATRQEAFDYFTNAMARTGYGTASLPEATTYNLERLSNDYFLMITLYRNHWIARRIVDLPAVDMTRSWPKMQCDRPPQDLEKFKRKITRTYTPSSIRTALKWARLYGGAGGLITIRGHEDILDEPLDLDDVNPGTFLGIIPFDRWVGIYPEGMVRDDYGHPSDWGMPEYYSVRGPDTSESFRIHASRILRFSGPSVPTPELQAQIYWGISILEVVWEELKKRDNASFAILNLLFRANIIAQINPQLEQLLSGVGTNQTALKNFWGRMQAQNELMSNQSMLILGKDADMRQMQYSFSGMDGLYGMFQMDVAGAAEIPVTRLFGRTVTGLGQSNDADERYYEEMIASRQHEELQPQLDKLYPVIAMSEFGEVPDDMDITFPSVRILTEEEKAELLEKASAPVLAAYNAGLISQKSALKDLRQIGDQTGTAFTNITDEDIENADDEPVLPGGEELPEGFAQEESKPPAEGEEKKREEEEEEETPEKAGPVEQAAKKVGSVNPQRLLRKASGGAEDQKRQGKVVVEHQTGNEYLVMFPDGEVKTIFGKDKVISAAKAWFKKDLGKEPIGVGMIEWRGGAEDSGSLTLEQERVLLHKHATGDFPGQKYSTIQWLLKHGYLQEVEKNIQVTTKGKEYCDIHHLNMPSGGKRARDVENLDSESEIARNSREQLQKLVLDAIGRRKSSKNKDKMWHNLPVHIETKTGETRSGKDAGGKPWSIKMTHDYGELHGTEGVDGDPVDVFLGPDKNAEFVYVVHTMAPPDFEELDEDKCFLDFPSEAAARKAFYDNYTQPEFFGSLERFTVDKFIEKVKSTAERAKPISVVVDSEKLSKEEAGYVSHAQEEDLCRLCSRFIPASKECGIVAGEINPDGWCKYWVAEGMEWIGVDLDGTLALPASGDFSPLEIGPPNPEVVAKMRTALQQGYRVKVFTARLAVEEPLRSQIQQKIAEWTLKHIGTALESTSEKDPNLLQILDDRAKPLN